MKRAILSGVMLCMIFLLYLPIITAQETLDIPNEAPADAAEDAKPEVAEQPGTESPTNDEDAFDLNKYLEETQEKFKDFNFNETLNKIKDQETGRYGVKSIDNYFDTVNEIFDEYLPKRSLLSIVNRPSGSFFKKVKFACPGDFQASGVYFSERDINAYNGRQCEWSYFDGELKRTMTSEIEAFMYHDLKLNPRLEFANGKVALHMQFENGGYMWEWMFPDYHIEKEVIFGTYETKTYTVDTTSLKMTAIALEVVTHFGYCMVGKLPDPLMGMPGIVFGLPIPIPPFGRYEGGAFALIYSKLGEGMIWDDDRKAWEAWGWNRVEVQNADGYKDGDDATMMGIGGGGIVSIFGGTLILGGAYGAIQGGNESEVYLGMDIRLAGGAAIFMRDSITPPILNIEINKPKVLAFGGCLYGPVLDWGPDSYAGWLIDSAGTMVGEIKTLLDPADTLFHPQYAFEELLGNTLIDLDPTWLFASKVSGEVGKFTPDACVIYTQGTGESWQIPMIIPRILFNSKGNETPRGMLGSYLLSEVEDKYFNLVGTIPLTFFEIGFQGVDMFSSNMTAIKAGSGYRMSKHFSIYGAALAAWRNDVDYYKKNYWNNFFLVDTFGSVKIFNNEENNVRTIETTAYLQLLDVDYWEEDIDKFLGVEFNTKFVYHAYEGLEISFIAAYFHPGGFYEDILTPKRYAKVVANLSDITGEIGINGESFEPVYGPYTQSMFFELTDAYTLQLKFDLKWD